MVGRTREHVRTEAGGMSSTRLTGSTPLGHYAELHGHQIATQSHGIWDAPDPEGRVAHPEFGIDDITYDAGAPARGGVHRPSHGTGAPRRGR